MAALGVAWWTWQRVAAAPPLPDGLVFRARVLVVVPFTVLAITATSVPEDTLPSIDSVRSQDATVIIEAAGRVYGSPSGVDGAWRRIPAPKSPPPG